MVTVTEVAEVAVITAAYVAASISKWPEKVVKEKGLINGGKHERINK